MQFQAPESRIRRADINGSIIQTNKTDIYVQ